MTPKYSWSIRPSYQIIYDVCTALENDVFVWKWHHLVGPCILQKCITISHVCWILWKMSFNIRKVINSSLIYIKIKFPPSFVLESISFMGLDPKNSYMNMCHICAECSPIYSNIKEPLYSIHCWEILKRLLLTNAPSLILW